MKSKYLVIVVSLLVIGLVAISWLVGQRGTLRDLRHQIAETRQQAALLPEEQTARAQEVPAGETSSAGPEVIPPLSDAVRATFLRDMRKLIDVHDSGMSTFIPSKEYVEAMARMSVADLKATLSDLERSEIPSSDKHMMKRNLLDRLAKIDPAYVLQIAHEGGRQKWRGAISASVSRLTRRDPAAARAWLDSAQWDGDQDYRMSMFERYAAGLAAAGDIVGSVDVLEEIGGSQTGFVRTALAARSAAERASVVSRVTDEGLRAKVSAALVRGALYRDGFEEAKQCFDEQFNEATPAQRSAAILEVATETIFDGGAADSANWILERSDGTERVHNLSRFFREWVSRDYNAAATWLGDLESGPERNAAIAVLVEKVAPFDPAGAEVWRKEIAPVGE